MQNISSFATGGNHVCMISEGSVLCSGKNVKGQLGTNDTVSRSIVSYAETTPDAVAVAAGANHTCVLQGQGFVECFGDNSFGQSGSVDRRDVLYPRKVRGLPMSLTKIAVGDNHTCVLDSVGSVYCFGLNDFYQLGFEGKGAVYKPTRVPIEGTVVDMALGGKHSCFLLSTGKVICVGSNSHGQLGIGDSQTRKELVVPLGLDSGVKSIAAGKAHTCAILYTGKVMCFGSNGNGELGNGTTVDGLEPIEMRNF